ncbi:OLC1v1035549C1 [Oldenlandia corymbosa var. corymbosa]|uniref:OLC1v1035549C1 n=1 Tax=Oldenlandia corymbosa var. corymbosa TaxID=529605 RepID=A0AAV1CVR7_OLDCO|nr:OLC1v1035549C1 [Oldenlandia corymbosa var. corymbosa]
MNTLPNISVVDFYSTEITYQSTGIRKQSSQQQSNVGSGLFGERLSYLGSYRSPEFQTPAFQSPLFQVPVFSIQGQTSQVPGITPEMLHQRFSEIEHAMATQVERFEDTFQRLIDHNSNTGSAALSRSMTPGVNTATGAASSDVPPVSMVNNPLYHAIFQTSATDTPVQNLGAGPSNNGSHNAALQGIQSWYYPVVPSQPAFVSPPGNFTFDGRQLPPLSPQYGTPVMILGMSWGQQLPYQRFQAQWPVTPGMQQVGNATNNTLARNAQETNQFQLQNAAFPQQVLPMQHQQGSVVVLSQLNGQEGAPRLMYIPLGTAGVGVQGTAGVTINQGHDGTGNNQGVVSENARRAGQHVQATNDHRFILYQNRVPGNNTAAGNLDDPHIPQGSGVVVADPQIAPPHQTLEENREEQQDTTRLSIVDLSEIRQKFGEAAEAYLIRFRQMYAKIPDKYDEPTIFKMATAGIQDYKVKLAVTPYSVRSLNHLADIVRRCEKVIKDKREKNPGKTKHWFNKAPVAEVNQSQWVHDEDNDEYEVNAAEIVNVRNYTYDALRRPIVPHSYTTPPPVGAPAGTSGQPDGANVVEDPVERNVNPFPPQHQARMVNVGFGSHSSDTCLVTGCDDCDKVYNKTWVQKETRLDPEQEKLRAVSDAILNALNQNQQQSLQHQGLHTEVLPTQQRVPVHRRLGNTIVNPRANSPYQVHNTRPSVWQRIQCPSQRDNTKPRSVRAAPVNDTEWHCVVHPKFPTPPLRKEKMTRTQKQRWQRVMNKQNRDVIGKLGTVQEEQSPLSQQTSMNKFSGQEDRRSQLWGKVDTFFPPVNMVYMLPKTFRLKEPATATTIIPKAVADTLVVPEAASFVTEPHDATVGGIQLLSQEDGPEIIAADASPFTAQANAVEAYYYDSEVGPYRFVRMDKYGRPQQATMRRDMSLPEWKLLLQEFSRPYNYNMLRPLPAAPSIEEVSN